MVAGTSTGAIVGVALAAGVAASEIEALFLDHSEAIFRRKLFSSLRRGPIYDSSVLQELLGRQLGNQRIEDVPVELVVPTSIADVYEGRIFTSEDRRTALVDLVMATTAAPTYFSAHRSPATDYRTFLDGGLWANDPSHLAVIQRSHITSWTPSQSTSLVSEPAKSSVVQGRIVSSSCGGLVLQRFSS